MTVRRTLVHLYIFLISTGLWAQEYYFSNPIGMILSDAGKYDIKTGQWVLERRTEGNKEIRILYHNGAEDRRIIKTVDGNMYIIQELKNNSLMRESVYIKGRISEETEITSEGNKKVARYIWGSGNLEEIRYFKDGTLIYRDEFITGTTGALYKVIRVMPDGSSKIAGYDYGSRGIKRQWNINGEDKTIYFYNDDSLSVMEVYKDRDLVSSRKSVEDDQGKSQTDYNTLSKEKVKRKFDNSGRIIEEEITTPEKLRIIVYQYGTGDKLVEKTIKEPGFREVHEYHYDINGRLDREDVIQNGILQKKVKYLEEGRKEEIIYRHGTALMKVVLEDDVVISRENLVGRE